MLATNNSVLMEILTVMAETMQKRIETRLTFNCAHLRLTKESLTIEYLRIIFFVVEKKNVEGKYLEKENIFFVEEKKNGEGKGGKYLERENVTMAGQTTNKESSGLFGVKNYLGKKNFG